MIDLFDVFTCCGGYKRATFEQYKAADYAAEMKRVSIGQALVRFGPIDMDIDAHLSLKMLYDICDEHEGFIPCPLVLPNSADDFIPEEEQVDAAIKHGAGAVAIRPIGNAWWIDEWCSGDLFHALEDRRVPVFCGDGQLTVGNIAFLAKIYPQLPIIMSENNYRNQRIIAPFMNHFKNVYLSTGLSYNPHGGIEHIIDLCGPQQILFGTGWPITEAMASITYVLYCDLSDDVKTLVGSGNMKRLMGEIVK
jgi:hypothetical protein